MKTKLSALALAIAAALLLASGAPGASTGSTPVYYVALGDSLATGAQPAPSGETAALFAANGTNRGYVDVLYDLLRAETPSLRLKNLGCGGESTASMVNGGVGFDIRCGYKKTSQLAEALDFLEAHGPQIALVTIDIGANDLLRGGGVPAIAQNLPVILGSLRDALGPDVPLVAMNYYDPAVAPVWFQTQSLDAVRAEAAGIAAFNDFLEAIYQAHGVPVADVESAFSLTDLTIQPNGLPLNVQNACAWTWMCAVGDVHANDSGYRVIAQAFLDVIAP